MRHLRDTNDKKREMDKKKDCHRLFTNYYQKKQRIILVLLNKYVFLQYQTFLIY